MRTTSVATSVLLAGLMLLAALWLLQRRMIYFPFGAPPAAADAGLPQAEEITLRTEDGLDLGAWFVPAPEASVTVIVFNGNAGNRAFRAPLAIALGRAGISVLLFDYRGFGGNEGEPSETGLARDARAALSYLKRRPEVDAARIAYFGESLGTAVAAQLAAEHSPAALILRSPFTSLSDVGRYHYPFLPVGLLLRDRYETASHIERIGCPLLVIAGDRDSIIPLELSRRLYAIAGEPKRLMVFNADHNDDELQAGTGMIDAIVEFLGRTIPGGSTHSR